MIPVSLRVSSPKSSSELRDVSGEDNTEEIPAFSSLTFCQNQVIEVNSEGLTSEENHWFY